jgi:hypothetical protein
MNKKIFKPLIIIVIAISAFTLLWKNLDNTSDWDPNLFALQNPAAVDRMVFTPNNEKVKPIEFVRINGDWFIKTKNDLFLADSSNISMLLNWAMPRLKIKMPVSDQQKKHVVAAMAHDATKATFYVNNKPVHTIYVGGSTQDNMSTYMFYPDSDRPCIVEIPGFQGYLTPYFMTDPNIWKSPLLVHSETHEIRQLHVFYPHQPQNSFSINQQNDQLTLTDYKSNKVIPAKSSLMAGYLLFSKDFTREIGPVPAINNAASMKDSILKSKPLAILEYVYTNGKKISLTIIPQNSFEDILIDAKPTETETVQTALYWVKSSDDAYVWTAQDIAIKNRLKSKFDFIKP